jgi:hypothetical protein
MAFFIVTAMKTTNPTGSFDVTNFKLQVTSYTLAFIPQT